MIQLDENEHSTLDNADYQNSTVMPTQTNDKTIDRMEDKKR